MIPCLHIPHSVTAGFVRGKSAWLVVRQNSNSNNGFSSSTDFCFCVESFLNTLRYFIELLKNTPPPPPIQSMSGVDDKPRQIDRYQSIPGRMNHLERNANDVDFTSAKTPGNDYFQRKIREIVREGRYHPNLGTAKTNAIVETIRAEMMNTRIPPGRFLKNRETTGGSFELLAPQQIQQKVWKALQKEWKAKNVAFLVSSDSAGASSRKDSHGDNNKNNNNNNDFRSMINSFQNQNKHNNFSSMQKEWERTYVKRNVNDVDFTTNRNPGNDNFYLLVRTVIEDDGLSLGYNPRLDRKQQDAIADKIQGLFASLEPPGRFVKQIVEPGKSSHVSQAYEKLPRNDVRQKIRQALSKEWQHKNHMGK